MRAAVGIAVRGAALSSRPLLSRVVNTTVEEQKKKEQDWIHSGAARAALTRIQRAALIVIPARLVPPREDPCSLERILPAHQLSPSKYPIH